MGYQNIAWIVVVTAATVYFLNMPPPPLSSTLLNWQQKGNIFKYKEFDIFYIVEKGVPNDGSTLVLIHGFPTSSHDWSKILGDMKSQFSKIIMLDMLGYGFSDKPLDHDYLISEQADIHEALLTSLSISRAHVMSHDYGDTVALELLHRFNNKESKFQLESMCMLNGGVFHEINTPLTFHKLLLTQVIAFLSHFTYYQVFESSMSKLFGVETQPTSDEMMDFYTITQRKNGNFVKSSTQTAMPLYSPLSDEYPVPDPNDFLEKVKTLQPTACGLRAMYDCS